MIYLGQKDSIARMFRLFNKIPTGLAQFRKGLKEALLHKGQEINDAVASE